MIIIIIIPVHLGLRKGKARMAASDCWPDAAACMADRISSGLPWCVPSLIQPQIAGRSKLLVIVELHNINCGLCFDL